ncbi:lmo0937 family membrane protein [Sphingobium sp.]
MLWTILLIILVLWALGAFIVPVGGSLIHLLLVLAVIVIVFQLVSGRRVP